MLYRLTTDEKKVIADAMVEWYDSCGHDLNPDLNGDQIASMAVDALAQWDLYLFTHYMQCGDEPSQTDVKFRFKCKVF